MPFERRISTENLNRGARRRVNGEEAWQIVVGCQKKEIKKRNLDEGSYLKD